MSGTGAVNFTVTAVDSTTKIFDGIQKRIAKMNEPIDRLKKSFGGLSKATGLTALAKGAKDLGANVENVARGMGRVIEPLGVITGAASIAGLVRLTTVWANWGSQLLFSAQNIGMTATALQTWQGAAQLAGASSSSLSSGMQTLGQNMWDAIGGRAPQISAAMQMLGINWKNGAFQAKSVSDVLPQIADKIKALHDPYAQAAVATTLLGSAGMDLLPFLRLGSAGIAQYNAMAVKYGVTSQAGAEAANKLRMSQVGLTLAVQGLGNSIAEKLQPVLGPILDSWATWISNNRTLIATDITGWIKGFYNWIVALEPKVEAVINKFGGWQAAALGLAKFMGGVWLARMLVPFASIALQLSTIAASITNLPILAGLAAVGVTVALGSLVKGLVQTPTLQGSYQNIGGREVYQANPNYVPAGPGHYVRVGGPTGRMEYQAGTPAYDRPTAVPADVVSYLVDASKKAGLNPKYMQAFATQEGGGYENVSSAGAIGPMQLMPGTASDMGVTDPSDWHQNIDAGTKYFAQLLKKYGHYNQAAGAYNWGPGNMDADLAAHGDNWLAFAPNETQNYVKNIGAMAGPTGAPVNIGAGDGAATASNPAGGGSTLTVDINHKNAPPGSTVSVKSSSPNVKTGTVKVETAMLAAW